MDKCIGVIGIINKNPKVTSTRINDVVAAYRNIVSGRLGVPKHEEKIGLIALIVEGGSVEIKAFEQELKAIDGLIVSTALSAC